MDDNELISPGELGTIGESGSKLKNNGVYCVKDVNDELVEDVNIPGTAVVSQSVTVVSVEGNGSSSLSSLSTSFVVDKRQGLKKWRRIPRELAKRIGSNSLPVQQVMLNVNGDHPVQPDFVIRPDSDAGNLNGGLVTVLVDDHQRNGQIGSEKKARGFKIEKENSNENLTMEALGSDSGRSNFVFVQGSKTVASKGGQSGSFAKHDEESSDDKDLNKEAQTAFVKSDADSDDLSLAADNIEKRERSMEHDPLVESIKGLHSAQEELEREVLKWRAVGKDDLLIFNNPIYEILELKDAKIFELESGLSSVSIKTELEDCLMKIIQADVENVVITTTTKRLTEGPLREIKHKLQEKNVSSQGVQAADEKQATDEKSEPKADLKRLQNSVCRFITFVMIQLILLLVTLFLIFSPQNVEVVPT